MSELESKKQILFVDDDPGELDGLSRLLEHQRAEWEMHFAGSGKEALALMEQQTVDIIVSDLHMPHMDGGQLLAMVKSRHPQTMRFILASPADFDEIRQFADTSHQWIPKPGDAGELTTALKRALALQAMIAPDQIRRLIVDTQSLPTLPSIYDRITRALHSTNSSATEISRLIAEDMAMTAKVLQLVNSAFFGLRSRVESITHAVTLLGIDMIKAIVLTTSIFEKFTPNEVTEFDLLTLYDHSTRTGKLSHDIARALGCGKRSMDDAVLAGMIHDVGKIILVRNHRAQYRLIHDLHRQTGDPLHRIEEETLGVNHAQIGAYVLRLWGLPDGIVEAVAFHHAPARSMDRRRNTIGAVHLANALTHRVTTNEGLARLDQPYLAEIGVTEEFWRRWSTNIDATREEPMKTVS